MALRRPAGTPSTSWTLSVPLRAHIAELWFRDALAEHASIAEFARFALELMALGAPLELVAGAQRAMADEIAHTKVCLDLARSYGALEGPGALSFGTVDASRGLDAVVSDAVIEGCVGETVAAILAQRAAEDALPSTRASLRAIAEDEGRHAELAWKFLRWALSVGGESTRLEAARAFQRAVADLSGPSAPDASTAEDIATLRAHGRLDDRERSRATERAIREVILPCADALGLSVVS